MATRIRRTQSERTADAASGLVEAAFEVLAEAGYARLTLAEVGRRAGYSSGLASYHFGSKAALVHALMDEAFSYGIALVEEDKPADQRSLEHLLRFVDGVARASRDRPALVRGTLVLLMEGSTSLDPLIRERISTFNEACQRYVARLVETGVATKSIRSDIAADMQASLFLSMVHGILHQFVVRGPNCDLDVTCGAARELLRSAFAP